MGRTVTKARFENPRFDRVFFRELTLDGVKLFVCAGSAPPGGPTQVYEDSGTRFGTSAEAKAAFEKEWAAAQKGWQKVDRKDVQADGPDDAGLEEAAPENAALEAAAATAEGARVYADWLQSQGDLRGELAALHQAGKDAQADAFLKAHANALLGDLDVALGSRISQLRWRHGLLAEATLKLKFDTAGQPALDALTAAFLALPIARFVSGLRFGLAHFESNNDWTATLAAVIASPRREQITGLWFDEYTSEDCEISWTPMGDFASVWAGLPALETLHLRSGGGGRLGTIRAPRLKTFIRESGGLGREEIDAIVAADWPKLEHLEIWFGREEYGGQGTPGSIARILDGQSATSVTHLGLVNCEFSPELIGPLATSKILPRLQSLDLSKGILMDADADQLISRKAAFAHLKRLDLSENLLDAAGPRLQAALPNVVLGTQRFEDTDGGEYRYAAVGE